MDIHDISDPDYHFWHGCDWSVHRKAYIETGDPKHLRLMLRNIFYIADISWLSWGATMKDNWNDEVFDWNEEGLFN